jgi:hypothetical protein
MITTILVGIVIVAVPALLVLASLMVLGVAVAAFADAVPEGLVRPNAA